MGFLTLEGVSKVYGGVPVVRDVNLAVAKGEFVSLLGPSGCGKTTTLQMIAGLVEPSGGRIRLDGRDITQEKPNRRGLGIVFQSYALFPHMTVAENVSFGLEMRNVPRAERDKRVAEMLGLVHLADMADRYPRQLSGGQRQRVAIARALATDPELLVCDEAVSALDAHHRAGVLALLGRLKREHGLALLFITHDPDAARALAERTAVLDRGRLVALGATSAILDEAHGPARAG